MDYNEEGRVGATIVALFDYHILAQGTKGDGCFSWITIDTILGPVSISLVYALNEHAKRKDLWD